MAEPLPPAAAELAEDMEMHTDTESVVSLTDLAEAFAAVGLELPPFDDPLPGFIRPHAPQWVILPPDMVPPRPVVPPGPRLLPVSGPPRTPFGPWHFLPADE